MVLVHELSYQLINKAINRLPYFINFYKMFFKKISNLILCCFFKVLHRKYFFYGMSRWVVFGGVSKIDQLYVELS